MEPEAIWQLVSPIHGVQYDRVDFGAGKVRNVMVLASSSTGGRVEIRMDGKAGPLIAEVDVAKGADWNAGGAPVSGSPAGVHNLFVILREGKSVEIDWIKFE